MGLISNFFEKLFQKRLFLVVLALTLLTENYGIWYFQKNLSTLNNIDKIVFDLRKVTIWLLILWGVTTILLPFIRTVFLYFYEALIKKTLCDYSKRREFKEYYTYKEINEFALRNNNSVMERIYSDWAKKNKHLNEVKCLLFSIVGLMIFNFYFADKHTGKSLTQIIFTEPGLFILACTIIMIFIIFPEERSDENFSSIKKPEFAVRKFGHPIDDGE